MNPGWLAAVDARTRHERDADALAGALAATLSSAGARDLTVATHWARTGEDRHVALSLSGTGLDAARLLELLRPPGGDAAVLVGAHYAGPAALRTSTESAREEHASRRAGRAVVFPGGGDLVGRLTVAEILSGSTIDRVRVLAGGDARPAETVDTRGFVRPRWSDGELILAVQPALGGSYVPFELANPTPCCAHHA